MKSPILKRSELVRAGRTFFTVTRQMTQQGLRYGVTQYLVCGFSEPHPAPGEDPRYRVHPVVALFIEGHTDAWRTFRHAMREAQRRQRIYDQQTRP